MERWAAQPVWQVKLLENPTKQNARRAMPARADAAGLAAFALSLSLRSRSFGTRHPKSCLRNNSWSLHEHGPKNIRHRQSPARPSGRRRPGGFSYACHGSRFCCGLVVLVAIEMVARSRQKTMILTIKAKDHCLSLENKTLWRAVHSAFAENPLKNRVHMLGVIAKIEFLGDRGGAEGCGHLRVGQKLGLEIAALFPDLHRVALN